MCNRCGSMENTAHIVEKYNIPFKCPECGSIDFPYRPTGDKVFVWPDPEPEYYKGTIYIPEFIRERDGYGVILAIGKGYYDRRGKWHPTSLKVGERIIYDKNVPWSMEVEAPDGNKYTVVYMGEQDVKLKVYEE